MKKGVIQALTGAKFKLQNPAELTAFSSELYFFAGLLALLFLVIVFIICNSVKNAGGSNPKDYFTRRMIFWLMGIFPPLILWLVNYYYFQDFIQESRVLLNQWNSANITSVIISIVVYYLLGLVTSWFSKGKWGTITRKRIS